jgi:hypothetical protein
MASPACSDDVPGLVAEAESLDALSEKLKALVPELLDVTGVDQDQGASTEFQASRVRNVISAYRTSHWLVYSIINPWSE